MTAPSGAGEDLDGLSLDELRRRHDALTTALQSAGGLISAPDVASLLGVTRQAVHQSARLPAPVVVIASRKLWSTAQILAARSQLATDAPEPPAPSDNP